MLLLYTLMIGCAVSSVRALLMYVVRMGAEITGRVYDMPTATAFAAAGVIIWRPLYLLDAGFLLSFGAIVGLMMIYPVLTRGKVARMRKKLQKCYRLSTMNHQKDEKWKLRCRKFVLQLMEGAYGSLSIHLMLLPALLYFFFEFPPYSILLNLLVIPLMSWMLTMGMLGSLLGMMAYKAGRLVLQTCVPILDIYEKGCRLCSSLPMGRLVVGQPRWWQIWMYYGFLLLWCYGIRLRQKGKCCGGKTGGRDRV